MSHNPPSLDKAIELLEPLTTTWLDDGSMLVDKFPELKEVLDIVSKVNGGVIDADKIVITLDRNDPDLLGTVSLILQELVSRDQGDETVEQACPDRNSAVSILNYFIDDSTCELRESIVDELKKVRDYIIQPRDLEDKDPVQ